MGLLATPATIALAAVELQRLAATLAGAEAAHIFITQVIPSGAEEVSVAASGYFNAHSHAHAEIMRQAIHQLMEAGGTLARHGAAYTAEDISFEGVQKAIESGITIAGRLA